ncbi:MAG: polymer-forming cytoskeletal protein [Tissierellia bacterium]|nr:polymer-forming cytoskeletal protein [Tissierellia bacterium]
MFSNRKKSTGMTSSFDSFFGEDIVIEGNVEAKGNLRLDGCIKGDLTSTSSLVVGEKGRVEGNISGTRVEVYGSVEGNINAKEGLFIEASGKVTGDVEVMSISVVEGGEFNGNCRMVRGNVERIQRKEEIIGL